MEIRRIDRTESHLVIELFDKYRVFYEQESDIDLAEEFLQARLDNNESIIFVAFWDGNPAGFTQLYPTYSSVRVVKNWILNDLFVENNYRKKGIGESLIKTAMDFARDNGSKYVELSTATDNFNAQALYEKIGFRKIGPEPGFYTYRIPLG